MFVEYIHLSEIVQDVFTRTAQSRGFVNGSGQIPLREVHLQLDTRNRSVFTFLLLNDSRITISLAINGQVRQIDVEDGRESDLMSEPDVWLKSLAEKWFAVIPPNTEKKKPLTEAQREANRQYHRMYREKRKRMAQQ